MNIILIPPSDKELGEAIAYYNDQFPGLGDNFYDEFMDVCSIFSIYPSTWRKIGEHTHRINLKRFPYLVLYAIDAHEILITCIAHHHREPAYYIERIY
jgi:toxin ParE2